MKKILLFVFAFSIFTAVNAQDNCCRAFNPAFNIYCLAGVTGCSAGTAPCDDATFDAIFGANTYTFLDCATADGCPGNCDGGNVTLPIELIGFSLNIVNDGIEINWATASEVNNKGVYVEKSTDGKEWASLGFIEGNIASTEVIEYSYKDTDPSLGRNYYRLKQVDLDGTFEYSPTLAALWRGGTKDIQLVIVPNPAIDKIVPILPPGYVANTAFVYQVLDVAGKTLLEGVKTLEANITIDVSSLERGAFMLKVTQGELSSTTKFVKQ